MEDILASIKRIIAEDGETPQPKPRVKKMAIARDAGPEADAQPEPVVAPQEDDAPPAIAEPQAAEPAPIADPQPDCQEPEDVLELSNPVPPADAPSPARPTPSAAEMLLSDPAAQASRSAFAALSQMQLRAETGQENTLTGLVADLLRPMLKDWLDRELPALVEKMVAAEIARISRG